MGLMCSSLDSLQTWLSVSSDEVLGLGVSCLPLDGVSHGVGWTVCKQGVKEV